MEALIRKAFETPAAQERLRRWAERIYEKCMARSRHGGETVQESLKVVEKTDDRKKVLMKYVVPIAYGKQGEWRGAYDVQAVARVLVREYQRDQLDTASVLRALTDAEVEPVEPVIEDENSSRGSTFDPLNPSTWETYAQVRRVVKPPSADECRDWIIFLQGVYARMLLNLSDSKPI